MKKTTIIFLFILFFTGFSSYAQTYITQVRPAGSKLWGYANLKGEVIIQPQFEKCFEFSNEGLAAVYDKITREFYFINTSGSKIKTQASGYKIKEGLLVGFQGFSDGLIQLKIGEKWGYMDKDGNMFIAAKYDETSEFNGGHAIVRNGTNFIILDDQGIETPVSISGVADIKSFHENMAVYKTTDKKVGFINTNGMAVIAAQFESVGDFSAGLAWAKKDKLLGYINTKGDWVIQPQFEAGKDFESISGLARVKKGEQWSYITKTGETISITCSETIGDFSEGLADGKKGEKKGFYNSKGEWVIQPQFDGIRDFKNGYAAAKQGDKWGVIDKQGKWVIEPKFDAIKDMELVK